VTATSNEIDADTHLATGSQTIEHKSGTAWAFRTFFSVIWDCHRCPKVNEIPSFSHIVKPWLRDFSRPISTMSFTGLALTRLTDQAPIGATKQTFVRSEAIHSGAAPCQST
jgi:hypothetical protein